jgi:NAD(P)-dependent dehydrogenase (short-subunit alcohol dehydrogenase family)
MAEKILAGKTAWVTGSSRGLGQAMAALLAQDGANVIIHGSTMDSPAVFREGDSLAEVAEAIAKESGGQTMYVAGDLTKPEVVNEMKNRIVSRFGGIDILVNNAGGDIGSQGARGENGGKLKENNDALNMPDIEIRTILDRNLLTCINVCKAVVPGMIERKEGCVVNLSSVSAFFGHASGTIYGVAKAAVNHYTRCLAAQVRPCGIRVNAVAPGSTLSKRLTATRMVDETKIRKEGSLDRYGWPEEIAKAVEFFVLPNSSFITGQILLVDGGSRI